MTERERLIEILKAFCTEDCKITHQCGYCDYGDLPVCASAVADHLLANGVIVPPVALGSRQKVYVPIDGTTVVYETKVYGIGVDEDGDMVINPHEYPEGAFSISGYNIGKTVFLTKEEAERALKERNEGK